jgi:hypothetical protein
VNSKQLIDPDLVPMLDRLLGLIHNLLPVSGVTLADLLRIRPGKLLSKVPDQGTHPNRAVLGCVP